MLVLHFVLPLSETMSYRRVNLHHFLLLDSLCPAEYMNMMFQLLKHNTSVQLKNSSYNNEFKDVNETSSMLFS